MQKACLKIVDKSQFIAGDIINAEAHPNSASRAGQKSFILEKPELYELSADPGKKILQDNIRTVSTNAPRSINLA